MSTDKRTDIIVSGLVKSWEELTQRLTGQKALETKNSEEVREAGRIAAEIVDLAAVNGLDRQVLLMRSEAWSLMTAAAETSRKRLLSTAARRTTLIVESQFEADGSGQYRFINNSIVIVGPTGDKSDFLTTAAAAIKFLIKELGMEIDWTPEILEGPTVFGPTVLLDAGPDKDRIFESLQIRFFKRDVNGNLARFDPKEWQLELKAGG